MKLKRQKYIIQIVIVLTIICVISFVCMKHEYNVPDEVSDLSVVQDISDGWESMFDGKTLANWEIVQYGGEGIPYVKNGTLILPMPKGGLMTGVCWVGDSLPVNNYVIRYEARRVEGFDIFAALSFPYNDMYASLIFGGWGGIVNGLSCIDGYDASENETTQLFSQTDNLWYPVLLCVTTDSIRAFVGTEQVVDISTAGKELHLRSGLSDTGFTLWSYMSTGEIRDICIKKLTSDN